MGFFSWHTNDTDEPIMNKYSDNPIGTIYMIDNKGNKWQEDRYEGYGMFGGKDYHELLAEMNGLPSDREDGISLAFDKSKPHFAPQLVRNINHKWQDIKPKDHEGQGFWSTEEEYA